MNFFAAVVACYGLLQNSTAVVIGAMIIAMLLGPINGLALGINFGDWKLLRRSGLAEGLGVLLVMGVAIVVGRLHLDVPLGSEILARTKPNILDLVIAAAGGAAGAYSMISPRLRAGVVGVAIATALVPPLASAGLLFARGDIASLALGSGAFVLFLTNLVTIQATASAVFWVKGFHSPVSEGRKGLELVRRNGVSLTLLMVLGVFLFAGFRSSVAEASRTTRLEDTLGLLVRSKVAGARLSSVSIREGRGVTVLSAVVQSPRAMTPGEVGDLEDLLEEVVSGQATLFIRTIVTKEASRSGWLHETRSQEEARPQFPGDTLPKEEASGRSDPPVGEDGPSVDPGGPGDGEVVDAEGGGTSDEGGL